MKQIEKIFDYKQCEIRTIFKNNQVWFVAKDVCNVLEINDVSSSLRRLDEDEKDQDSILTPGGTQEMSLINESGLYSLILGSRKPEAKSFKRWVTHEVIPSIRQTGSYSLPQQFALPQSYKEALLALVDEIEQKEQLQQVILEQQPKVELYNTLIDSTNLQTVEQVAKSFNVGRNTLFYMLRSLSILMQNNLPYQRYINSGYFRVKEYTRRNRNITQTLVTSKGIDFIGKTVFKNEFKECL